MAQIGPPFDFSKLDAILDRIMSVPKKEVAVGFPTGSGQHDGKMNMATLGAIHDLGAPGAGIPERPFLRQSVVNRRKQYTLFLAQQLREAMRGAITIDQAYGRLGAIAASGAQVEITRPSPAFVPLKKRTIARKGSSKPLIDTGHMRQAISYVVRDAQKK